MGLQFILGNSGSGKTRYIQDKIIKEAGKNPKKNYLIIVPEQFTMQTQRELVALQKNNSILNIDILSFQRMAFRTFDELGTGGFTVLEETGKNLVLRKVAQEKKDSLTVLKSNMTKTGYISEMKSLISELTQYHVTPQELKAFKEEQAAGNFFFKLSDILTMYEGFEEFMSGRFITAEEVLNVFISKAPDSEILKGSVMVFDGFTGFTPIQNQVLKTLMKLAEEIYVTATIDKREDFFHCEGEQELFAMSKKMTASLMAMAREVHIPVKDPVFCEKGNEKRRADTPALYFLEQNLFRPDSGRMQEPDAAKEIELLGFSDPREELKFTAATMKRLVREEHMRYKDMAVVCGDMEAYGNYAEEIFDMYQIPVFLDRKTTVLFHPFIAYVRAILSVTDENYSYDSVFSYLRSPFSGFSKEETDLLENYVIAAGIRGHKKWSERFVYRPKGYGDLQLEELNCIRERVFTEFEELWVIARSNEADVEKISKALYQFFVRHHLQQLLKDREEVCVQAGELKRAKEYAQIYRIVIDLMDKMVELLGKEQLSVKEYAKLLDAGFEAAKVGIIPPGYDRVMIGDMERTRLNEIKILFFVGVNDGNIPKSNGTDGIISQTEREKLKEFQIELAPGTREQTFIQRFYLYLSLTKPRKKLYLTYAFVNAQGKSQRRSYLIGTLLKLFPKLKVKEQGLKEGISQVVTAKNSLSFLAEHLYEALSPGPEIKENRALAEKRQLLAALYEWFLDREAWKEQLLFIEAAAEFRYEKEPIAEAVAKALYGTVMENSVTRLEQFAACAFAHFLAYGLKLKERQVSSFEASDIGTVFHGVLEAYAKELKASPFTWFDIPGDESEWLLEKAIEREVSKNHNLALYQNERSLYAIARIKRILSRTIWALTKQVRLGSFVPEEFEVSFSFAENLDAVTFRLGEEEKMRLKGRIDRIDTFEEKDKLYVKIIDYKSGNTNFQFLNVYYGLQLQLVVYMNAALELMAKKYPHKEVNPAGIFYYHIEDPMIEEQAGIPEEELKEKILEKLKLNGLANKDPQILNRLDHKLAKGAGVSSGVIPVGLNKDGTLKKTSKAISSREFYELAAYADNVIKKAGEQILGGDAGINPYRLQKENACQYCPYHAVCQFDQRLPGHEYRKLKPFSEDEAFEKIMQEKEV